MITIFTPTYNREPLLHRLYASLEKQSCKDFEWLVVDDGSTDDTLNYIGEISKKASFKIVYIRQKNGGKHRAFNNAVNKCKQKYMLLLDSDDYLTPDAIEILMAACETIKDDKKICGVIGNRAEIPKTHAATPGSGLGAKEQNASTNYKVIGTKIPNVRFASGLQLYQKLGFKGDTMRLYKTEVLRKFPFPEIDGENFVSENVIFDKIDQKYKMLVIQEIIYLCEYQECGLSKNLNKIRLQNPIGNALALKSAAETALNFKKRLGLTTLYIMWTRKFHIDCAFRDFRHKLLYILCYPLSFVFQILRFPRFYFRIFEEEACKRN